MLNEMAEKIARRLCNWHGEHPTFMVLQMKREILELLDVDLKHLVAFSVMVGEISSGDENITVMDPSDHRLFRKFWKARIHNELAPGAREAAMIEADLILDLYFNGEPTDVETVDIPKQS